MDSDIPRNGLYVEQGIELHNQIATSEVIPLKRSSLDRSWFSSKKISQKKCINTINYLHFAGSSIFAHVTFPATDEEFFIRVYPGPCLKDVVTCMLSEGSKLDLQNFDLKNLIVDDGKQLLFIKVVPMNVARAFFSAKILNQCFTFSERTGKRIHCQLVDAEIQKEDIIIKGVLEDFNPNGLHISTTSGLNGEPVRIRPFDEVLIKLYNKSMLIFSGTCQIIRSIDAGRSIILKPLHIQHSRFKERKNRNPRVSLIPIPKVIFDHPFSNKRITYEITDITTSGFSVIEDRENALLMAGMIIPSMTILYAGGLKINCSAQIVYSSQNKFRNRVRHGLSIIDMTMKDYSTLFDIVSNAVDPHANMSAEISMEDLWEFFFDAGFIYAGKYEHLSLIKEKFKDTYKKLYHNGQDIFTNFTYQKNGRINGHNCTIRAYQRSWMIHHLAARSTGARRIGLDVLKHSHYFFDGMYRLPSIGMDYMIMYFRPDNRFPDYFFGGFSREFKTPKACSMDLLSYLTFHMPLNTGRLPEGWTINRCTSQDIDGLREWYNRESGGLAVDVFGLDYEVGNNEYSLEEMYSSNGLKRCCTPYVLKQNNTCSAYLIVDQSDAGINLSELLNSIKIFILDQDLPWEILQRAVAYFRGHYETDNVPLIIYPVQYLTSQKIPYEKEYYLWVLNTKYGEEYVEYIKQTLQFRLIKYLTKLLTVKILKR